MLFTSNFRSFRQLSINLSSSLPCRKVVCHLVAWALDWKELWQLVKYVVSYVSPLYSTLLKSIPSFSENPFAAVCNQRFATLIESPNSDSYALRQSDQSSFIGSNISSLSIHLTTSLDVVKWWNTPKLSLIVELRITQSLHFIHYERTHIYYHDQSFKDNVNFDDKKIIRKQEDNNKTRRQGC